MGQRPESVARASQAVCRFNEVTGIIEGEAPAGAGKTWDIFSIPRSREVGQSYLTSMWTTLVALKAAHTIVFKASPEVVSLKSVMS